MTFAPLVNDAKEAEFAAQICAEVAGADKVRRDPALIMASEDFSYMLAEVPGCYLMLGASVAPPGTPVADNHSPRVEFDEAVLPDGALLHAQLAVQALRRDAAPVPAGTSAA